MGIPTTGISFTNEELGLIRSVIKGKTGDHEIWKVDYRIKEYQKSVKLCDEAKNHPVRIKLEALLETALAIALWAGVAVGCWALATAGLSSAAGFLVMGTMIPAGLLSAYYIHRWQSGADWIYNGEGYAVALLSFMGPFIPLCKVLSNSFEATKTEKMDDMNRSLERCKGSIVHYSSTGDATDALLTSSVKRKLNQL